MTKLIALNESQRSQCDPYLTNIEVQGYKVVMEEDQEDGTLLVSCHFGKDMVGCVQFELSPSNDNLIGLTGFQTSVVSHHRRKGIATAMYVVAEKYTGRKILKSPVQSDDAKALWGRPNRPFGYNPEIDSPLT